MTIEQINCIGQNVIFCIIAFWICKTIYRLVTNSKLNWKYLKGE